MAAEDFLDTNVVLYFAASGDKSEAADALIARGGTISVQVLNETAAVCRRKFGYSWERVDEALALLRSLLNVVPVTIEVHEIGLRLARRYQLPLFDSMLLSAALLAECDTFWSEDLQDGMRIEEHLTIRNPFTAQA